ncbi:MAG: hypothetical protein J5833_07820 [Victivallales bacterium]|nr:hypothetical protein [Victivallales bacterium]
MFAALAVLPFFTMQLYAQNDAPPENNDGDAQAAEANPWQPEIFQEGRMITIANYTIENPTALNSSPLVRGSNRPRMWRFFMNGVSDGKGYPVPWQALGIEVGRLDTEAVLDISHKKSNLPALLLKGGETVSPTSPVITPEAIYSMRGQTLRFFVWIMADEAGKGVDLWKGAPTVKLTLVDGGGNVAATTKSVFKTRGTYPWFCYHLDMKVPFNYTIPVKETAEADVAETGAEGEDAAEGEAKTESDDSALNAILMDFGDEDEQPISKDAGLYISLANPVSGKVWFSTLSWQRINPRDSMFNPATRDLRLDPETGSYAPNPDYDELPMHFFFGFAKHARWNFFHGTKVLPDMTRKANLEKYLAGIDKDWLAMQYALPYLVTAYNNGKLLKTLDDFEEGWDATLAAAIKKLQDSRTGMWCVNGTPNIFVTEQIITNCFAAKPPVRKDWTPQEEAWKGLDGMELNYSDALIATIVSAMNPAKKGAAWNDCAFQNLLKDTEEGRAICDMTATAAAARILRYAMANASEDSANQAQEALKHAWEYVSEYMILLNGLWKNSSLDSGVTIPGFMFKFLDATDWMTIRQGADMLPVQVKTKLTTSGQMTLSWTPDAPFVALRVFAAPTDVTVEKLNESHVVAILQPRTTSVSKMDPLLALRFLTNAAKKTWGITPRTDGADYLAVKYARTSQKLQYFDKTQNVKFNIPVGKRKMNVYVAAVNAYGEMSPVFTLPEKIIPAGGEEYAAD